MFLSGFFSFPLFEPPFLLGGVAGLVLTAWGLAPWARSKGFAVPGEMLACAFLLGLLLSSGLGDAVVTGEPALPPVLPIGLILLVVGQRLANERGARLGLRAAWTLPGTVLISVGTGLPAAWLAVVVAATILAFTPVVASFESIWDRARLMFPFMAVSSIGIYYTVPDPEEAMILMGAALALVPLALAPVTARLAPFGSSSGWVAVVTWVSAAGGYGRPSSVVGGILTLGLPAVEPVARHVFPRLMLPTLISKPRRALFLILHGLLVLVASRIIGLQQSVSVAILGGFVVVAVGVLAVLLLARSPSTTNREASEND
jgi:hypothetical protein